MAQDGNRTVYEASGESWSLVVDQPDASSLRAIMVIDGPDAPTAFPFDLSLAGGASLQMQDDGSVVVLDDAGEVTLVVQAPWAVDATGTDIPTSFTVDGTTLTQHVEHAGAAYPVNADPVLDWGYLSGTVYFNRNETYRASTETAYIALALGAACGGNAACSALTAFQAINIQRNAAIYYREGDCLKLRVPGGIPRRESGGSRYCSLK